ncbi:hypothetical protein KSP39_PZI021240 [Platanthera zijinensis]|uniref:4-coumarate--CoA ligase n=1 Tax=Platanthera zijinensis TaxID=2320716 RepID=A0AAP0FW63_9ASPA
MASSPGHICHCLSGLLHLRRESTFIISGDRRRTGMEFVDGVLSLACGLLESGLLHEKEVVAIAALNSEWYMEWMLAVTYVGGIIAPFNYRWVISLKGSRETCLSVVVVIVSLLLLDSTLTWRYIELQVSLKLCALIGGITLPILSVSVNVRTTDSIRKPSYGQLCDPICSTDGVALICFTSGTTGQPKGVAISHKAIVIQSLAKIAIVGYGEDDVYLHTAPLCHIGGISSCMAMLMVGGCHVFIPKFDAKLAFAAVEQCHVTSLITVPAMMADLIILNRKSRRWSGETVNKILNGGGSLSEELVQGAINVFPKAKIISAYGMTEACSSLTYITLHDPAAQKLRSNLSNSEVFNSNSLQQHGVCVGKPAPHIELKISCDRASSGSPLMGRILTRGLHVMAGYWHQSAQTFDSNDSCWLDTGDVGWLDSRGKLWLLGRTKDRIKSGGENIYPEEVEAVLRQHSGVAGAVVVGIPDNRLTEKVVACVSIRENWRWVSSDTNKFLEMNELSSEMLRNFCRQRNLTGFKIPKVCMPWRKPFPLTTTGKVIREDVKKEILLHASEIRGGFHKDEYIKTLGKT